MKPNSSSWLRLAFIAGVLAVGLPFWLIPYNRANLPDALLTPGLVVVCVSALLLRLFRMASFRKVATLMAATVPAAVLIRVLVEGVRDPTSHNLWPLEVIIAVLVGLVSAVPGAIGGVLLTKLLKPHDGGTMP